MKTHIKIASLSLLLLVMTQLRAQQPGGIVVIQSGFDPVLTDAFKINTKAHLVDTLTSKPIMNYNIEPVVYQTQYTPMSVNPAKISGEPITRLYRNLIKIGMGNYTTPYVELFVNNTRSSKTALGAHIRHINSTGSIKDYAYPGYANSDFELYGKQIFTKYTLEGSADYNRNQVQYFGFNPSDFQSISLSKGDLRHLINLFTFDTKLSSNNSSENKLQNDYRIKYHYLQDNNDNQESALLISSNLSKRVKWLKFTDSQTIGGVVSLDYINNKWDTLHTGDYALIKFQPFFSTTYKEYQLKVGLNAVIQTETAKTGNFHAYPFAEAKFTIVPSIMSIKAGVTGDINRFSYQRAMYENPFLGKNFDLSFENTEYKFYAAFESNLSSKLQLNIFGDASKINDMVFYVTDTSNVLKNTFNTVIDETQVVHLRADISYYNPSKWSAILSTNYYQYTPATQNAAWHKPVFEISLLTNYNIQDKIILQVNAFILNGIVARDMELGKVVSKSLNTIFDFNLGLEYRYTKNLGAFLNINNIASTRNYEYYHYPSQRFNFMLGISYSFGGNQPTAKNKKAE